MDLAIEAVKVAGYTCYNSYNSYYSMRYYYYCSGYSYYSCCNGSSGEATWLTILWICLAVLFCLCAVVGSIARQKRRQAMYA